MDKFSNINPVYVISGVAIILLYYLVLILYERKLKKRHIIKNFNEDSECVKNIHILADNFESAPTYNKVKAKPIIKSNESSDWQKTLEDINDLERELHSSKSLDQFLLDNDIDTEK
ncbi:hypothetical protein K6T82_23735 [Flavobacterium sp. 17A]|uniref:Uncharacterized protein n=1 Tax=Flavobacterium potami TaxID=2872310 RepID=A0A9X1HGT7_9FLAO|nr:hypothetical protein [Flavobacterium potami]MBZ4037789.1 hypothetical protein [Flavobacterium potami]